MSILNSIIQAILQSVFEILPLSESAHSSAFHEFAGRADGSVSALTGIIHIAIGVGIILATYNVFSKLTVELFRTFSDIFKKNIKGSSKRPVRRFMYFTLVSFVPLLLWLIPFGHAGFLYTVLHRTSYNGTLLDEGIFLLITGGVVLAAARQLSLSRNDGDVNIGLAVFAGFICLFTVPVAGFSLIAVIFSMMVLLGVSRRPALRYALTVAAPILLVLGIVETCIGTSVGWIEGILGAVLGVVVSFVLVRVLRFIIKKGYYKYFGIYDMGVGVIIAVVGIFQLALN